MSYAKSLTDAYRQLGASARHRLIPDAGGKSRFAAGYTVGAAAAAGATLKN
jgi:hypothetical protein